MSIEKNIERIANALEALVAIAGGKVPAPTAPVVPAPAAQQGAAGPGFAGVGVVTPAEAIPANAEQLRALAASIAQTLGKDTKTAPKVLAFTNWVSGMLLPFGVSKLIDVKPADLAAVSREIYAWAKKEGVNV